MRIAMLTLAGFALSACNMGDITITPPDDPVVFGVPDQLVGTVGVPFSYSFCRPALTKSSDLCSGASSNPVGGHAPYHFQLASGTGFPPTGLTLGLNGILSGTPSAPGTYTFRVCAVDLDADSECSTVTMVVAGTVTVGNVTWSCTTSAAPLPGWRNCTGAVTLTISTTVQSGYVSVFFNYPTAGSFFHGELAVTPGPTQTVMVNLINEYVSQCVAQYNTTVEVYDGRQNAAQAPLLVSKPVTLSSNCT